MIIYFATIPHCSTFRIISNNAKTENKNKILMFVEHILCVSLWNLILQKWKLKFKEINFPKVK